MSSGGAHGAGTPAVSSRPDAQTEHRVRLEWGIGGAAAVASPTSIVAVVDVLSFTTTLSVAAELGIEVFPYRFRDDSAAGFARRHDATLALSRARARAGEVSLSPASLRDAGRLRRLVLPSPNGSTIAHTAAGLGRAVVGVSLRNVASAAAWIVARLRDDDAASLAVVAAGERWSDGTLRPAVEDLWGAGAFLDAVRASGIGPLAPEAEAAVAAYRHVAHDMSAALRECVSGRELLTSGYGDDVTTAGEVDATRVVPVLHGLSFRPAA